MTTRVNESKVLVKHISCNCRCKFIIRDVNQSKKGIIISVNVSVKK